METNAVHEEGSVDAVDGLFMYAIAAESSSINAEPLERTAVVLLEHSTRNVHVLSLSDCVYKPCLHYFGVNFAWGVGHGA